MNKQTILAEQIALRIRHFRGEKVLLDFDPAALYGVAVKVLNQSVKRNHERFPNDFMFQLSDEEARLLRSQILALENRQTIENDGAEANWSQFVTSSRKYRGTKYRPYAFTFKSRGNYTQLGTLFVIAFLLNAARAAILDLGLVISFPVSLLAIAGFYRSPQPARV
jgi:hypothetical protein